MAAAAAHDAKGIPRRPHLDSVEKDAAKDKAKPAEESAKKEDASQSPSLLTKLLAPFKNEKHKTEKKAAAAEEAATVEVQLTLRRLLQLPKRLLKEAPAATEPATEAAAEKPSADKPEAALVVAAAARMRAPPCGYLFTCMTARQYAPVTPLKNPARVGLYPANQRGEAEPAADKREAAPVVAAAA
ncbi:hypothetical protein EV361DRAFT_952056 [Lentinula raphanica]|nr:hypothetical protein EV361DRAFT_952056 [Lentinula raphanica]